MSHTSSLRSLRRPTVQTWVGVLLVALLLVAEAFAVGHRYDAAAHANGQPCAVCLSVASFGAGAVATPLLFDFSPIVPAVAIALLVAFISVAPTRRYARGPPAASFTS